MVHRTRPSGGSLHTIAIIRRSFVKYSRRARALRLVKRRFQTAYLVAMADVANGLRTQRDQCGNLRRADAFGQLQQKEDPQDYSNLLNSAANNLCEFLFNLSVRFRHSGVDGP